MSLHHRTATTCDGEGCNEVVVDDNTHARQIARKLGWVLARRNGITVDLCPAHQKAAAEETS